MKNTVLTTALVAVSLGLGACAGSPGAPTQDPWASDGTGPDLLMSGNMAHAAIGAVIEAGSGHLRVDFGDGQRADTDFTWVAGTWRWHSTFTIAGTRGEVVGTAEQVLVKDQAATTWRRVEDGSTIETMGFRESLVRIGDPTKALHDFDSAGAHQGHGDPAHRVFDFGADTVTLDEDDRPIRIVDTTDRAEYTFSDWGSAVSVPDVPLAQIELP